MRKHVVVIITLISLPTLAWGQSIEKRVLDQVKDATAFIKLKAGRLQGSGSGFVMKVTGDTILVMTNRHVASPATGELPEGQKVELSVVLRSGTPQQQELPARLLAYDERDVRDLAVLEVRGVKSPPVPILADQTAAESDFFETMQVYALGFPLGSMIQGVVDNRARQPGDYGHADVASAASDATTQTAGPSPAQRFAHRREQRRPDRRHQGAVGRRRGSRLRGESVGFAIPPSVDHQFPRRRHRRPDGGIAGRPGGKGSGQALGSPGRPAGQAPGRCRPLCAAAGDTAGREGRRPGQLGASVGGYERAIDRRRSAADGQLSVPVAKPEDRKLLVQFVLTDLSGRTIASKPTAVSLPERPGSIEGLAEALKPKTPSKWSCEVNLREGAKINNAPGRRRSTSPAGNRWRTRRNINSSTHPVPWSGSTATLSHSSR